MKVVSEIKVVTGKSYNRDDIKHASALKFTYDDLVHFFGQPVLYDNPVIGRSVEWALAEFDNKGNPKLDSNGNPIVCFIYDSDSSIAYDMNFVWYIDAWVNRGFEIVAEYIQNQRDSGKQFVSKELPEDIKKHDKDKIYKVNLTGDQKKIMEQLKKMNDEAKSKDDKKD